MKYTHRFNGDIDIWTVRITGTFTRPSDAIEIENVVYNLYKELDCNRFLVDMTEAHIVSNTIDTFTAGNPSEDIANTLRTLRVAVLYSELSEDERFLENVVVNRGYMLHVFDKSDEAIEWLVQ
jgi:hypothetical protein